MSQKLKEDIVLILVNKNRIILIIWAFKLETLQFKMISDSNMVYEIIVKWLLKLQINLQKINIKL